MLDVLLSGGISAVVTANNHAMDFGPEALEDQLRTLQQCGLPQVGAGLTPAEAQQWRVLRCGDVDLALIAFDCTEPLAAPMPDRAGVFHVAAAPESVAVLRPIIREARARAHLVVVSPHWGENWEERPSAEIRTFAKALIDAGADAILGHSSHVLHGVEVYRGCPIVYDMGCLIFDRVSEAPMRDSALVELSFDRHGLHEVALYPLTLKRCRVRKARGTERARIAEVIASRSAALNGEVSAVVDEHAVRFRLVPDPVPRTVTQPSASQDVCTRDRLAPSLTASGYVTPLAPALSPEGTVVDIGGGLTVGGFRHPRRVAYRYGFVCEIRFRCAIPQQHRWRGDLMFLADKDGSELHYRYPLADGLWHASRGGTDAWFADRILCRTPSALPPGSYRLYWSLWTRDTDDYRLYWNEAITGERGTVVWVDLGDIEISREAPRRVAGVEWDTNLAFCDPAVVSRKRGLG